MKKLLLSFILISTLHSFAQNANWGTGLPVNVTVNGSSLDLSVFDPILNQTKTTSLYLGSNPFYLNNEGVIVATGSGTSDMKYAIYDVELHTWKSDYLYLGSTSTVLNSGGVVVGTGSGTSDMKYATYDAQQHTWKSDSYYLGSTSTVLNSDGVVVGTGSGTSDMKYATYDAELHTWKNDSYYLGSTSAVLNSGGVVLGTGSGTSDMKYAIYDAELHTWKSDSYYLGSTSNVSNSDGVVVGTGSGTSDVKYAIYDFNLHTWKSDSQYIGSSGSFSLNGGTITYTGSSSGIRGYNYNTQSWGNYNTIPACKFIPVIYSGSTWVYMQCLYIGAHSFTYSCGDGHQISRKQGWKKYNNNNSYSANLNVTNGLSNSTCNATINIAIGIEEYNSVDFQIFPNPSNSILNITSAEKISEIKMYNSFGALVYIEKNVNEENKTIQLNSTVFSKGMYFVEVTTADSRRGVQKVIVQ